MALLGYDPDEDGIIDGYGAEYLVYVSSRSLKMREKYTNWDNLVCLSLYIFWGKCVYFSIFKLADRMR